MAPDATTIVELRTLAGGAADSRAGAPCGFWLGSSHSLQYRHFTAAS